MRQPVTADNLQVFMKALAAVVSAPSRIYLVGGATAVLLGWRTSTIDIDLKIIPESDEILRKLPELKERRMRPWSARLFYAYADALLDAGRTEQAREWFARAAAADPDEQTDAAERFDELDDVVIDDLADEDEDEDQDDAGDHGDEDPDPEGPDAEGA